MVDIEMKEYNSKKRNFDDMQKGSSEFKPRGYQIKVCEVAVKRNTIAVLETGAGKTMISVMLMKKVALSLNDSSQKKLIVFLAPTVNLVHQQFGVIKDQLDLRVAEYYGSMRVDDWTLKSWEKEINEHDILVMTPQILFDALRKGYVDFRLVCLLILDECHHAIGNHPYFKIMEEFYHKSNAKPKIFGMTASPLIRKGVSSMADCEAQLSTLESILDSQIYTVEDRAELQAAIPSAMETSIFYIPGSALHLDKKKKLESSKKKFEDVFLKMQKSVPSQNKDAMDLCVAFQKRLDDDYARVLLCLDDLGIIGALEGVQVCLGNGFNAAEGNAYYTEGSLQCKKFLLEVLSIISSSFPNGYTNEGFFETSDSVMSRDDIATVLLVLFTGSENLFDLPHSSSAVSMGYISSKFFNLLKTFVSFGDASKVQCLIFVDRIIMAEVIVRTVKRMKFLSHFSVAYVTGCSSSVGALSPSVQKKTLESFRSGKINLLFATDVVEEGTDIPACSYVIRFDLPKTVRSYIQSRGRARQKDSQFILMLERGNIKQKEQILNLIKSEQSMTNAAVNRDPNSFVKPCAVNNIDSYTVERTGAFVNLTSSAILINQYLQKLPKDKHFVPKPEFYFLKDGEGYKCSMTLPPSAAFQTLLGPQGENFNLSQQLVCLEACKKLHELGALDDHLVPVVETPSKNNSVGSSAGPGTLDDHLCSMVEKPSENNSVGKGSSAGAATLDDHLLSVVEKPSENNSVGKGSTAGAGTTKRKELHGTTPLRALSGTWHKKTDYTVFQAYTMHFSCNLPEERFSSFILLLETKLEDDVGNVEFDLYLVSKFVRASVAWHGELHLSAKEVGTAKRFQEFFFNGLFGKLFIRSKSDGKKKFLLQMEESLWDPSYMYLLLPLVSVDSGSESPKIDWAGVSSCASVVEFLKMNAWLRTTPPSETLPNNNRLNAINIVSNVLHFANRAIDSDSVKEMVVVSIHTGKLYSIVEVVDDSTAESPFDGNTEGAKVIYSSYSDYFNKMYGIVLMHPGQPMLRLKQNHNAHNLLVEFRSEGVTSEENLTQIYKKVAKKKEFHIHMPPELLVVIDTPISMVKSLYLLPSMMHRLESLMLASQLRDEISHPCNIKFRIPSSLILEAITTLRCNEVFSHERLELLGDSVLKYGVSCSLFLMCPDKHEGQLSSRRSWEVCNSTLHKRGTDRKLQGYIRDRPFDPRRWSAPGQKTLRPYPCSCGVDTLEVPLDSKFQTEDPTIMTRKGCDMGHRWMGSKTISDCVEGLIGAYYVGGGLDAALHLMKWLGITVDFDFSLLTQAIKTASLRSYVSKVEEIQLLEDKIGYSFTSKGLLLEAITHSSNKEQAVCYERLEFLGDSILDLLITRHLYQCHTNLDPGELTDLRSASVNNEFFAHAAVRNDLHQHLQHSSGVLVGQISKFVKYASSFDGTTKPFPTGKLPKALGDLVESIAGAIFIDTSLDLEQVWRIYEPLLSPIVTPDKLELPPWRDLLELCASLGCFMKENFIQKGEVIAAEVRLQLKDVLLIAAGISHTKKTAKAKAASILLKDLESRGISNPKKSKQVSDGAGSISTMDIDSGAIPGKKPQEIPMENLSNSHPELIASTSVSTRSPSKPSDFLGKKPQEILTENISNSHPQMIVSTFVSTRSPSKPSDFPGKKPQEILTENKSNSHPQMIASTSVSTHSPSKPSDIPGKKPQEILTENISNSHPQFVASTSVSTHSPAKYSDSTFKFPALPAGYMVKGGPRQFLYEQCRNLQWPVFTFTTEERKSRTPMEFREGSVIKFGYSSFVSTIALTIPGIGVMTLTGDQRADKSSSKDSAAALMIQELHTNNWETLGA